MSSKTAAARKRGAAPSASSSSSSSTTTPRQPITGAKLSENTVKKMRGSWTTASKKYTFELRKKEMLTEPRPWTDLAIGKFKETQLYKDIKPPPRKHFISFTMPLDPENPVEFSNTTATFMPPPGVVIQARTTGIGYKSEFTKNMADRELRLSLCFGIVDDDGTFSCEGFIPKTMLDKWEKTEKAKFPQWSTMTEQLATFYGLIQQNISDFTRWICDDLLPGDGRFSKVDDAARRKTDDWYEKLTGLGATAVIRETNDDYVNAYAVNRAIESESVFHLPTTCAAQLDNVRFAIICTFAQEFYFDDSSCNRNWEVAKAKAIEKADAFIEKWSGIKWSTITAEDFKDEEFKQTIKNFLGKLATITIRWKCWKLPKHLRKNDEQKTGEINEVESEYARIVQRVRSEPKYSNSKDNMIYYEADRRIFPILITRGWIYVAPKYQRADDGHVYAQNQKLTAVDRAFMPSLGCVGSILSPGQIQYDPGVTPFGTELKPSLKLTTNCYDPFILYFYPKIKPDQKTETNNGISGLCELEDNDFDFYNDQIENRLKRIAELEKTGGDPSSAAAAASSSSSSSSSSTADDDAHSDADSE